MDISTTSEIIDEWIDGLSGLARLTTHAPAGKHLAVVIAPPSPELSASLLGTAAVLEADPAHFRPEVFDAPVSYVTGRKLYDSVLRRSKTERRISLHAQFHMDHRPEMVLRPLGLEARPEAVVPEAVLATVPESEATRKSQEYFRYCIRPVVILTTRPTELAQYFASLNLALNIWEPSEQAIRFTTSTSLDAWFRSPILIATPEQTRHRSWLAEVSPTAVIVIGWKSWRKPARWNWPEVTHFLVLDVRSEDIDFFRGYFDGTEVLQAPPTSEEQLSGPAIMRLFEPQGIFQTESDWGEEEDLD